MNVLKRLAGEFHGFMGLSRRTITSTNVLKCSASDVTDSHMPVNIDNPFEKEKEQCILCRMNVTPNYKNVKLLSQFVSQFTGRVYGRHITGLCKRRQEQVEMEIMKSQNAGLMPYYFKDPVFCKDPKLFNPEKPFRPHSF